MRKDTRLTYAHNLLNCVGLKRVQLYTSVAPCMYKMCHIHCQNFIESDRIKKSVCERGGGGGDNATELSIIMHFLCVRSLTRF